MDPAKFAQMREEYHQQRLSFINADLDLCRTFLQIAETEAGFDEKGVVQAIAKAQRGYEAVSALLPKAEPGPERQKLERKLQNLKAELDAAKQRHGIGAEEMKERAHGQSG